MDQMEIATALQDVTTSRETLDYIASLPSLTPQHSEALLLHRNSGSKTNWKSDYCHYDYDDYNDDWCDWYGHR